MSPHLCRYLLLTLISTCFITVTTQAQKKSIQLIPQEGFGTYQINDLAVDGQDTLWVATNKGLIQQNGIFLEEITYVGSINYLLIDQDSNKWLGKYDGQVWHFSHPKNISTIFKPDSIDKKYNRGITTIHRNQHWLSFGDASGHLHIMDIDHPNPISIESIPLEGNIHSLFIDLDHYSYLGSSEGLWQKKRDRKWKQLEGLLMVKSLQSHNEQVWGIGLTTKHELAVIRLNIIEEYSHFPLTCLPPITIHHLNDMVIDHYGRMWIATDNGLIQYHIYEGTCKWIDTSPQLTIIDHLALTSDQQLWLAAESGALFSLQLDPPPTDSLYTNQAIYQSPTDLSCEDTLILSHLHFEVNRLDFLQAEAAEQQLTELANYLVNNRDLRLQLFIHTSKGESPEAMLDLAKARADFLKSYFRSKGVSKKQLHFIPKGMSALLYPDPQRSEERRANRRVEVVGVCE